MDLNEYSPEEAMHFLSGIVDFHVCAIFETDKKLNKTYGVYAKPIKRTGNFIEDLLMLSNEFFDNFKTNEYCTTKYNDKDFKLLKYSEDIWSQWKSKGLQQELLWKEE